MHTVDILRRQCATYLFEFVADEGERLVDGVRGARDGDDALRTRAVADVDLGAALQNQTPAINVRVISQFLGPTDRRFAISSRAKPHLPHL